MTRNVLKPFGLIRVALAVAAGLPFLIVASAYAQVVGASPGAPPTTAGGQAEVERVIVTGSNIPTAEETGPNPVDTYRPQDIEKLGVRNATDLLVRLPQEAGGTTNQNIANGGDGSVFVNLRGLLPKETLVLVDGKRMAITNGAGVDINLIPFPFIDHIDILKDGASAIYGADAVAGVVNIFLKHKFRGLEIGGSIGNTNLGASNDARETTGWILAGTGDDKTDILIGAFVEDRQAIFSADRGITENAESTRWGGGNGRSSNYPGRVNEGGSGGSSAYILLKGLLAPTPHSAPNAATSPEYELRNGNVPFNSNRFGFNFAAFTPSISAADRQSFYGSFEREICDKYLVVFADFKYTRGFFDGKQAPVPFTPDPFHTALGTGFSPVGISVPISNPFNPFTVADTVLPPGTPFSGIPVTTGVKYRGLEQPIRTATTIKHDMLFDGGLRGELGEFGISLART